MTLTSGRSLQPLDVVSLPRPGVASVSPGGDLAVYSQLEYNADTDMTSSNLELIHLNTTSKYQLTKPRFGPLQSEPFFLDDQHVAYFDLPENETVMWYRLNEERLSNDETKIR
ncbi:hypothetical protein BJV82DRAFT_591365 [Fennellomyces sp. T-0311]|nr:hypothetical protein BJV82DRAFT_591365 [Fennellomyces sp. T-0311]